MYQQQQQQQLIQQPWQPPFQQPQFQQFQPQFGPAQQAQLGFGQYQAYQGPGQQGFAGYGQLQIQPSYQQPPYQGYQIQMLYADMKILIAQEIPSYLGYAQPGLNRQFPLVATLELLDLNQLTNDPILYAPWWPIILHKLPSDIPKFNGNLGEDPSNHVMTFHLWCSSNSLNDDLIRLHLFQRRLTGPVVKWYIELRRASFNNFTTLATTFLTHF